MRFVVLGAGMMGRAVVYEARYSRPPVESVKISSAWRWKKERLAVTTNRRS
jgi:hypothetical protein